MIKSYFCNKAEILNIGMIVYIIKELQIIAIIVPQFAILERKNITLFEKNKTKKHCFKPLILLNIFSMPEFD